MLLRRYGARTGSLSCKLALRFAQSRVQSHARAYATDNEVKDVAVLGGGITGLTTAYYITKAYPQAKVTIYEHKSGLGGWLSSKRVEVDDNGGSVLFEQGPRSLRPGRAALATAHLLQDLGLANDIIWSSKLSPAALNRFIYYPDHLVRLPSPRPDFGFLQIVNAVLSEPVLRALMWPTITEALKDKRNDNLQDESVGSFFSRRLSPTIANTFASAMMHGIYAGDVNKLSVESIFPALWAFEGHYDSMSGALLSFWRNKHWLMRAADVELNNDLLQYSLDTKLEAGFTHSAVYTFRNGIGQITDALVQYLRRESNVSFRTGTKVCRISTDEMKGISVTAIDLDGANSSKVGDDTPDPKSQSSSSDATDRSYTHLISTVSTPVLTDLTTNHSDSQHARVQPYHLPNIPPTHAVTVQVVSLYYPDPRLLGKYDGFGYLIPASVPLSQNPERALGVIFDSSYSGYATSNPPRGEDGTVIEQSAWYDQRHCQDSVAGTKITVMLGGHWWDGYEFYPSETEALEMATSVLQRHLGINIPPRAWNVALQKNCIPQYTVGHSARMKAAHEALRNQYRGRLRVAGSWYTGVGVNDCVNSAWRVVKGLREQRRTGLEGFAVPERDQWVLVKAKVQGGTQGEEGQRGG
ncbi:MAG: oxygen-dependent protoporphyrinogen oxidase [Bogoriella megaspora]|nr:MAG: oxygen-dependent protoporphyrinogen oxidase [Bogoriella megaspora]